MPAPANGTEPSSRRRLARITTDGYGYVIDPYFCQSSGGSRQGKVGSSDPEDQDIVLKFGNGGSSNQGEVFVRKNQIDFDEDRTYYFYIDDKRYTLGNPTTLSDGDEYGEYNHGECDHSNQDWTNEDVIFWRGFFDGTSPLSGTHNIYLASEEEGEDCEYYIP